MSSSLPTTSHLLLITKRCSRLETNSRNEAFVVNTVTRRREVVETMNALQSTTWTATADDEIGPAANKDQLMGALCFLIIGVPGFLINTYVVANAMRMKSRSSFIILGATKAACNVYMLGSFLFISVPLSILQVEGHIVHRINLILGMCLGAAAYSLGLLIQVVASLNRITATFSVRFYSIVFNQRLTACMAIFCVCFVAGIVAFFTYTGVEYYFHKDEMIWYGDPGAAPAQMALDITGYLVYFCTSFMFVANCITFAKLIRDTMRNSLLSDRESSKRNRRNKIMFAQKLCQDCLYLVDMSFVQLFSKLLPSSFWVSLICFSLIWMCTLLVDGIVMVCFTRELREPIRVVTIAIIAGRRKSSVRPLHAHRFSTGSTAF